MDSENPEDFGPALILTEEEQQEIGGLINSDGEEVDFSDLSEQIVFSKGFQSHVKQTLGDRKDHL